MEPINPYAVMRNTKTFEAYRAYSRAVAKAGQPFLFWAFLLMIMMPVAVGVGGSLHLSPPLALASYVGPVMLAALLGGLGALRMARYRREHPIPEEWRQIPRIRPHIR